MILVLAGTQDGREIVEFLTKKQYAVIASVVSDYGKKLLADTKITINDRPLLKDDLQAFIQENQIDTIIDATHPYATHISQTAIGIAENLSLKYIRYERQAVSLPPYDKLFLVKDYEEAALMAAKLGQTIFLTTGSRNLNAFSTAKALENHTVIVRVLPEPKVLAECIALGFLPKQIIAMQGPFSHELNKELFKKYQADVIITKNSGNIGGTDTKLSAAMSMDLSIIMIDRPSITYPVVVHTYDEILNFVRN